MQRLPALASALCLLTLATPGAAQTAAAPLAPKPAAIEVDGAPPVPLAIAEATRPYLEFRSVRFQGWNPIDRTMLIATRFANTRQLHTLTGPLMDRHQISFESEPVSGLLMPGDGTQVVIKDKGGDEFFQFYTLKDGRLTLLTDGKSRNEVGAVSHDGHWLGYRSTRRNGVDADLYVIDPRHPETNRLVAQVTGGGWQIGDFAPDGKTALVTEYVSVARTNLYRLDLSKGTLTPLGGPKAKLAPAAFGKVAFAPDGKLWATSDAGSDFLRLGTVDLASGRFTARSPEPRGDVEDFDIAPDGRFIAYTVNIAGESKLRLFVPASGTMRDVAKLPAGVIGAMKVAPWGTIGLSLESAKFPADAFSVDPISLAVTRWTASETGGLDPARNAAAELVEVKSFDGEPVSGYLYRPDPAKFPGKRPVIVDIHGGPEGQSRPGFRGRTNYLVNELGIAVLLPNVRGSTGFGKRFVALDNGPFKREDSVRDIEPLLDRLAADPQIDGAAMAVTGGSYGGYMCYASAIRYGARLKAAACAVAISNFVTFLQNTQGYRRDLRRVEYGDERNPVQRAQLLAISPLTHADRLAIPLMVTTGGNDPRVPRSEAEQMVKAVRAQGRTAWHLIALDEGHGYAKKANQDYQFWTEVAFWKQNLLGER
ncbi:prolyl oligopeptidase family serine peptidase [Novosphingobium sp. FKTRR1]|uniref:S9 family peptidase n=1 Tax=Novosphingobium sp. FKTRR1 TaxID=2879118 RepID=UPI001CF0D233|nr:prolyl oligopeptidase family serine peptidase [Novosphingobium sp. FKTRR1]